MALSASYMSRKRRVSESTNVKIVMSARCAVMTDAVSASIASPINAAEKIKNSYSRVLGDSVG
jgi:hypothetical protein